MQAQHAEVGFTIGTLYEILAEEIVQGYCLTVPSDNFLPSRVHNSRVQGKGTVWYSIIFFASYMHFK